MEIDKEIILQLSTEEKRQLAFELLDSIDEEYIETTIPAWKLQLIKQRLDLDKEGAADTRPWNEVREKYFRRSAIPL